ncbi:MAG: hypothetical protein HY764_00865 [Candidatus Portnoybacteria bacterium]|nr:hypothetical protein [Candidatus Portnoybacteria bacterium]
MEKILWFLGGFIHALFHPDSSFLTLGMAEASPVIVISAVILFSSLSILALYGLNKIGWSLFSKKAENISSKACRLSSGIICRFGYTGLIILCLIPFLPLLKETALISGQILGLRYTLFVILFFNAIRLMVLFFLGLTS